MHNRRSSEVGPDLADVRSARRFVLAALEEWGVEAVDEIAIVASELVTNALMHAHGQVEVAVQRNDHAVRLEVSDGSALVPIIREVTNQETTGRGMRIVEQLTDRWGADAGPGGKTVWVEIDL
jgi:anti-sigma regulatory factor (Ser/Thr protein kinase)